MNIQDALNHAGRTPTAPVNMPGVCFCSQDALVHVGLEEAEEERSLHVRTRLLVTARNMIMLSTNYIEAIYHYSSFSILPV